MIPVLPFRAIPQKASLCEHQHSETRMSCTETSMSRIGGRSFLRFLLVGGSATLLHYAIMATLIQAFGCPASVASATGYCLSTLYNYWASAHFTFADQHDHARSLPRFLVTAAAGLGINQLVLLGLIRFDLPLAFAQITATAAVLLWNYFVNASWAFGSRHSS